MDNRIEALRADIEALENQRETTARRRAQALADLASLPRMSADYASAKATVARAETGLDTIARQIEAATATLEALEARAALLADPSFEAETQATIAQALALRSDLDRQLAAVAKHTDRLAAELTKLQELEAEIAQTDPAFDRYQSGRASTCTWLIDRLSGYLGKGRILAKDKPELPGTGFAGPAQIERNLREAASNRAARIVRQRELSGDAA